MFLVYGKNISFISLKFEGEIENMLFNLLYFSYVLIWYPNLNKEFKSKLQTVQNRCITYYLQL